NTQPISINSNINIPFTGDSHFITCSPTITTETTKKNKKIKTKNQNTKQNQKNTFKTEIKKIR
ncbi:hypothetical protein C9130_24785, partial (plasmid) [Escherichia coli]